MTVNPLSELNEKFSDLLSQEITGYEWLSRAYDLANAPELEGMYSIKKLLIASICTVQLEHEAKIVALNQFKGKTVYIAHSEALNVVKIGLTTYREEILTKRLKDECPDITVIALFKGAGHCEKPLRKMLKPFRQNGDWYKLTPDYAIRMVSGFAGSPSQR